MGSLSLCLQDGKTVVLLDSSGVGKSTLINALEGAERQKVGAIREDDSQSRHITTVRELRLKKEGFLELQAAEKKKWKKVGHMAEEIRNRKERGL